MDCQNRKCAILKTCTDTMDIIDSWVKGNRQKRFKFEMENGVNYYIPVTSLFRQRMKNQHLQCDFMVQAHKELSKYSNEYPEDVVIGRPFFEQFYMVFNYTDGNMTLKVGPRSLNDFELQDNKEITERVVFSGNLLVLVLSLVSLTLVSSMVVVMSFSNMLSGI